MTVTSGFQERNPEHETAKLARGERLTNLPDDEVAQALVHAIEVGQYIEAAEAYDRLRAQSVKPEVSKPLTIPSSWSAQ